jgi:hypothetical protein
MPTLGFANDLWREELQLDDKVICKGALFITPFFPFFNMTRQISSVYKRLDLKKFVKD